MMNGESTIDGQEESHVTNVELSFLIDKQNYIAIRWKIDTSFQISYRQTFNGTTQILDPRKTLYIQPTYFKLNSSQNSPCIQHHPSSGSAIDRTPPNPKNTGKFALP